MISKEMFVKWFEELSFIRGQRNEIFNSEDVNENGAIVIVNYDSFASGMLNDLMGIRPEDCTLFYFSYVNARNRETGVIDEYDVSNASKMYDFICNVYPNVTIEW